MISRRHVATAATILMLGNVASRLLGIVREQVIAGLFGATGTTSAFVAAATVPTMVYDLLIGGAISAALVPVFSDYGDDRAARGSFSAAASSLLTMAMLAMALLAAVLIALAPQLTALLAPGLDQSARSQGVGLVRLMMPGVVFLGLSGVTSALLYARQKFAYPAFAVAAYNAGLIALALLLAPVAGINSLALGIVAGAVAQLAVQWPGLRDLRLRFSVDWQNPALRRVVRLYLPVALGLVVSQIGVIVDRNLASRTGDDSLAVMRVATTLVQFPLGLVATALSFSILPGLSRLASAHDRDQYKRVLAIGLRIVALAILPATAGLILLRLPLVQLLFEHGAFDARASARTSLAFLAYAPQLPFAAVDQLLIFAFYARKNTMTPMLVGVLGVAIYFGAGLAFIGPLGWGMPGLALANTMQNSLHAVVLLLLLRRAIGSLRGFGVWLTWGKALLGSAALSLALIMIGPVIAARVNLATVAGRGIYFVAAIGLGGLVYALVLVILRTEEAAALLGIVRRLAGRLAQRRLLEESETSGER